MEVLCRDEIALHMEELINISSKAIFHLESMGRNMPNELSLQEGQDYKNKLHDEIKLFIYFKENIITLMGEAFDLPQTKIPVISDNIEFNNLSDEPVTLLLDKKDAFTTISNITFCGIEYNVRSWSDLLITVSEIIIKERKLSPDDLSCNINLRGRKNSYFANNPTRLKRPKLLSNGCFVEIGLSSSEMIRISYLIMQEFRYRPRDLEILFGKSSEILTRSDILDNDLLINGIYEDFYDDPIKMLKEIEKRSEYETKKPIIGLQVDK